MTELKDEKVNVLYSVLYYQMTKWMLRKPSVCTRVIQHVREYQMFYRVSISVVLFTLFIGWLELPPVSAVLFTLLFYLVCGGWRFVRLLYLTLPRDLRGLMILAKHRWIMKRIKDKNQAVVDIFEETVKQYGDKVAFIFEDKQWTFKEVDAYSNKVANYFQSIGYKKGDVVAVFMENRPEFVFFWLGLSKIGVISALINYNLKKDPLSHCISIVNAKGLVYSAGVADAVCGISTSLEGVQLFGFGAFTSSIDASTNVVNVQEKLKDFSRTAQFGNIQHGCSDILFYMYTSGTTGYPKACVIRNSRFCLLVTGMNTVTNTTPQDVFYNVLPLYHATAGIVVVGSALVFGATVVVREKFSASRFWPECIKYRATCIVYVGELCRYLLSQPARETDKMHSLRVAFGNGLRPQIWQEFQTRFNIPVINELYGATEGNVGVVNVTGYPGAIGFIPVTLPRSITQRTFPVSIFKVDPSNSELLRGSDGLCLPCKPGEVGQIMGKIREKDIVHRFDGYLNKNASSKKIAQNVVMKGDKWFVSGDTLFWDELGYLFFHDRLGDTFRWRGENVSTTEVEGIIMKVLGLSSVVVFGIQVPGCEGRAGMAAIEDPDDVIDISSLGKRFSELLPPYACPVFLRITNSVDTTGTFKFQKTRLCKDGFDTSIVSDKLFYLDQKSGEYRVLTEDIYRKFQNCEMRM